MTPTDNLRSFTCVYCFHRSFACPCRGHTRNPFASRQWYIGSSIPHYIVSRLWKLLIKQCLQYLMSLIEWKCFGCVHTHRKIKMKKKNKRKIEIKRTSKHVRNKSVSGMEIGFISGLYSISCIEMITITNRNRNILNSMRYFIHCIYIKHILISLECDIFLISFICETAAIHVLVIRQRNVEMCPEICPLHRFIFVLMANYFFCIPL